tara:strand:+ start:456 stop:716 length:261 start_codon:yes stop_codon:yes gene_type:complete
MQKSDNTSPSTQALLQALERKLGRDFVETLFEDFLNTDAFASFNFFTDMLSGAYLSTQDPQFALLVQGNADMFLNPADLSAENPAD